MGSRLGEELRQVRQVRGCSLKTVASQADISTAYLQKLEGGEVKSPSPNILHSLAAALEISYARLMELADYVVPVSGAIAGSSFDQALVSSDLDEDERKAVAAFIAHLRDQRESRN